MDVSDNAIVIGILAVALIGAVVVFVILLVMTRDREHDSK